MRANADNGKRHATPDTVDPTHVSTLSQVYEGLLLFLREIFLAVATPRHVPK
ncbi:MAG: hypothetical protein ACREU7_16235 [Burkholderiales bacterium]